jgi:glyoxylase I family protein
MIRNLHHIAIITNHLEASLDFYCRLLGFEIVGDTLREERNSRKIDLQGPGCRLELFTFPGAPPRPSFPEAAGLRHLAFEVADIQAWHERCTSNKLTPEPIRFDDLTGKHFFFVADPDGLPIEFYAA